MHPQHLCFVPYGSDPLQALAELILDRHPDELPDLSRHVVLFPHLGAISDFRRALISAAQERGYGGVLAPWCGTLDLWLQQQPGDPVTLIDEPERDLLLLQALEPYPALRERYGTWTLVDSLLGLFDELNAHHATIPADADALIDDLAKGYGIAQPTEPLQGEARLVHTLWKAWNEHLAEHRARDRGLQRRLALSMNREGGTPYHIYMVGPVDPVGTDIDWIHSLQKQSRITLLLHGSASSDGYHPDGVLNRLVKKLGANPLSSSDSTNSYTRFIETVYAEDTNIGARARKFASESPVSPFEERLCAFAATDFEQEARAVEIAVRRWYAAGVARIAVVTTDRKLARRVRALLERANLRLRNTSGWALSTTSAATAVMRWIECVEQDFAQAPLLDFLKSPFVTLGLSSVERAKFIRHFEEDIVRRYNISSGLDRYRRAIRNADRKLGDDADMQLAVLDRLAAAAQPLTRLVGARLRLPADYLAALNESLAPTGLLDGLSADAAGSQVLTTLRPHQRALGTRGLRLSWSDFSHWLQRELERRRFQPPLAQSGIELVDLLETRCRRFDAVIIAGCTRDQLPGSTATTPFFNDGVRRQLKLATREERLLAPLYDFRRLLESAPRLLLTWRETDGIETLVPSPLTERLLAFHELAYGTRLDDSELRRLVGTKETELHRQDGSTLPSPARMPTPTLSPTSVPNSMSASSHQRLLDCPYQFYVVDGLGLRALDDVCDEMEKPDYGLHVHRILHAFHTGVPGLPGPWSGGPITPANREQAVELLLDLGRRQFAYDTDKRLSARGWRQRWETFVAVYLDWQQLRERKWQVHATEQPLERALAVGERTLLLKGRADRIDRRGDEIAILDYKTGAIPDMAAVIAGEKAQLAFYALLHPEAITETVYAQLTTDAIKTNVRVESEVLARLVPNLETRLRDLISAIDRGQSLPAWGDSLTCRFCRYEGICRKEMWSDNVDDHS